MAFAQIKATFERDNIKYEQRCEKNRENAIIRWNKENSSNAIAYDCIQTNTNYADSDNDSESDRDSDSDYILLNERNCFNKLLELYPNRYNSYDIDYCYNRYHEIMNKHNLSSIDIEIYFKQYLNENKGLKPFDFVDLNNFWKNTFEEYIINQKSEVFN